MSNIELTGPNGGLSLEQPRTGRSEAEILAYVNKHFNTARTVRLPFEREWVTNISFYFGRMYVQWATTALGDWNRLYEPKAPPWRVRLIINKIRQVIRKEHAKVNKERARGYVLPRSTDDDDLMAARAADSLVDYLWDEKNIFKIMRRSSFWMLLCGSSFLKDWWDPLAVDASQMLGDIKVESISPFHLYAVEPQEEEIENQPIIIHAAAKSPQWVRDVFNVSIPPEQSGGNVNLESRFLYALGISNYMGTQDYINVKEAWIKPTKVFPDGAVVIWAGNKILGVQDGWPFEHKEYPFAKIDHIPSGKFWGTSSIVDLIPLNKELNRTRSQIVEAKNRMAKPQLAAQKGSVDPKRITSEPGLIIFYQPGFQPPSPIPLTPLPNYVVQEVERIQRDIDDLSHQHEVSKGSVPPGVTAATAISYLQESDDTVLADTTASMEWAIEKLTKHMLWHVQQNWQAERTIRVLGDNGQFDAFVFSSAKLRGNVDFKIESGSTMPISRAAKQAFIMELGKLGWISPTQALRYMEMAETGRLHEEMMIDVRQAQRENLRMRGGEQVMPNTYDNHQIHIIEHNNDRKTQSFELLSDEVKMAYEQHVELHKQAIAQSMGMAMPPGDPRLNTLMGGEASPLMAQLGTGAMAGGAESGPPGGAGAAPEGGGGEAPSEAGGPA